MGLVVTISVVVRTGLVAGASVVRTIVVGKSVATAVVGIPIGSHLKYFISKKRRKISPIRIMIYILLAGYWIWFGMTQCGVDKTTS